MKQEKLSLPLVRSCKPCSGTDKKGAVKKRIENPELHGSFIFNQAKSVLSGKEEHTSPYPKESILWGTKLQRVFSFSDYGIYTGYGQEQPREVRVLPTLGLFLRFSCTIDPIS